MDGTRTASSSIGAAASTGRTLTSAKERLTITVPELGRLLGISRNAAYRAVRQGEIPSLRVGAKVLVPRWWLDEALACATRPAAGDGG